MINFNFHNHMGYKAWVAQIVGTDPQYKLARKFVGRDENWSKSGRSGDCEVAVGPGLYEVGGTKRDNGYLLVWDKKGTLAWCRVDRSRVVEMAKLMDAGKSFEEAQLATRKAA